MQSYGHDIEAAWLLWDAAETLILKAEDRAPYRAMCLELLRSVTERGLSDRGLLYECVNGEASTYRAWWPQAETMLGFDFGLRRRMVQRTGRKRCFPRQARGGRVEVPVPQRKNVSPADW